ncbi:hypothetical protein GCM10022240_30670 [Microbacterium kribbense]|uniref:Uncharacterized protein n=1 Tax=Microbacterium kribbense TaxID=433645 RepID=A0ABP7H3B8_9MICO
MISFSWMHLLVLLAAGLVLALVVFFIIRRWRRAGIDLDIAATLTAATLFAAISLLGAGLTLVELLTAAQLQMTVPVRQFWPQLPDGMTLTTAAGMPARIDGGFTSADLAVENVSEGARALWAIGQTLGVLVPAAIAVLIAIACFQLIRGRAFAPVVARMALVTAFVVLIGGVLAQALSEFAGSLVSNQLLSLNGVSIAGRRRSGIRPRSSRRRR